MKNRIIFAISILMFVYSFSQNGVSKGLLRFDGTYGIGINKADVNYYLIGEWEYLITDHIGWNGIIVGNLGSRNNDSGIGFYGNEISSTIEDLYSHHLFTGLNYHFFPNRKFDLFVGAHPGLTYNYVSSLPDFSEMKTLTPSFAVISGAAYYTRFFHLFGNIRQNFNLLRNDNFNRNMSELILSFGLGFNLNIKKLVQK